MDFSELDKKIDRIGSERAVAKLGPLLTAERIERIERTLLGRLDSLHVAVELPRDPYNAAAVVRTAEALGALHVHVVHAREDALHARKTTQGSFNWLHTHHHRRAVRTVARAYAAGACRLCGALMQGSHTLEELPSTRRCACCSATRARACPPRQLRPAT